MRISNRIVVAVVLLAALAGAAAGDVEVRTISRTFELEADQTIVLDVPLGEVFITPGESDEVAIEVVVRCESDSRRCRERAEEIYLSIEGYSNKLTSRPSVEVELRLPAATNIEVDMGVGTLEIEDLAGDVEVELGVGEVIVFTDRGAIGSLDLTVGVEIFWDEGDGEAHYAIEVGVGEIEVRLED